MSFADFSEKTSPVHQLDPRVRIAVFVFFSVLVCIAGNKVLLCAALIWSLGLLSASGISLLEIRGRLLSVNLFIALIYLSGEGAFRLAEMFPLLKTLDATAEGGLNFYILIILRSNSILLMATALINTMDAVTLGHALAHLKIPEKLAHLFLFTVRYLELIHREYLQMKDAMKARAFCPALNYRTYKALSCLASMLLIRSLVHAEKLAGAMKCRCFTGKFYMLEHFKLQRTDLSFACFCGVLWSLMFSLEVLCRIH